MLSTRFKDPICAKLLSGILAVLCIWKTNLFGLTIKLIIENENKKYMSYLFSNCANFFGKNTVCNNTTCVNAGLFLLCLFHIHTICLLPHHMLLIKHYYWLIFSLYDIIDINMRKLSIPPPPTHTKHKKTFSKFFVNVFFLCVCIIALPLLPELLADV